MKRAVALFDFDNTIVQGDSVKRLLQYDIKKHPLHSLRLIKTGFYYIGYLCHLCSFEKAKETLLYPLTMMSEKEIEKFFQDHVQIYYYPQVVEEMKKRYEEGCFVILCTASVETYMKYHHLPLHALLGTKMENGHIIGRNCKNEEKVNRILECLHQHHIEIDYDDSYGYSDSDDDIPMLSLVKNKKRVLLKSGEIVEFIKKQ